MTLFLLVEIFGFINNIIVLLYFLKIIIKFSPIIALASRTSFKSSFARVKMNFIFLFMK